MTFRKTCALFILPIIVLIAISTSIIKAEANSVNQEKKMNKELEKYPLPANAKRLKFEFSLPDEELIDKNVYLRSPQKLHIDKTGNIFVSDVVTHSILKFDSKGGFLKRIGRKGKGPGDFFRPFDINIFNGNIIVYDDGNHRIQILDQNGSYQKSFKIYTTYNSIAVNSKGLIFTCPIRPSKGIIDVINMDGNIKKSFGDRIKMKYKSSSLNQVHISINKKDEVFLAWEFFPIVRYFSKEGELISEIKLNEKRFTEAVEYNYKKSLQKNSNNRLISLIQGIDSTINNFYILSNYSSRIEIFEYNFKGELLNTYWELVDDSSYIPGDFSVLEEANKIYFYILQQYPDSIIDVLSINKSN